MTLPISLSGNVTSRSPTEEAALHSPVTAASGLQQQLQAVVNSQHLLIGKTIAPRMAEKTLHQVDYDGTGKILRFKTDLQPDEIAALTQSIIPPLKDTPAPSAGKLILTPVECLLKIIGLIQGSAIAAEDKQQVIDYAKAIYLAGNIQKEAVTFFAQFLHHSLGHHPDLLENIEKLINAIEDKIYYTKHNDNFFGRLFETRLAEKIISAPSAQMQEAAQIIKDTLITSFQKRYFSAQYRICAGMKEKMNDDWAPWYTSIPEVTRFAQDSSPVNFLAMLKTDNPLWHLLIIHLAVKYIVSPTEFDYLRFTTFGSYAEIIQPQRKNETYESTQLYSNRTGIQLAYQMKYQHDPQKIKGIRPIDETRQNITQITDHDKNAFAQEKPVGVGMSGSANLLNFFFQDLKKKHPDFPLGHARLLTACVLTHSGGHSINEACTVYNNYNFSPLAYNNLLRGDAYIVAAMDDAWDKALAETLALSAAINNSPA